MTAASYSQEVLQALMKEIREFQMNPQRNETFLLAQSDFNEWLRVWKMTIPEGGQISKDLFVFQKKTKEKFVDLVKNEIKDLKSVKVTFEVKIKFTKENFETGVTQEMDHYFKEKKPHVFNEHNKQQIKQEFDRFIEIAKGEIEAWSERGSGWVLERIIAAYVNVARYQPLRGETFLPLPANLAKKKAIINVQNRDNECLKWALRAALFPPSDGKNPQRTSKYPVNDGINYEGIVFPTPVKQLDKLEAQNRNLAINVFGWEDNRVIVHRISKKEKTISRINLMLIESGLIQHYCFVKKVSALLYDQSKAHNAKHFCMLCLTSFTRADLLENHEKYCNGMNGRPTRIEMPEKGKNTISFQNHHKQMKVPYVIYADFEALVRKISGCERGPESSQKSYTEKTEQHEACGFAYTVVRSDGKNKRPFVYRGIFPYKYMDSWERFNETSLPEKEKFYSKLNDEHITDEEYEHANSVWKTFGCETLGDYHNLYVKTDVTLLADVFENFRNICKEKYELDPAHYFTSPGLSWDALLKKTGVQLELLTDPEMHLFVERGIRGGISMASKRYAVANNPYVEGYDDKKPKKYIMYLDANNLYGWAMSKPLPKSGFKWKRVMPSEKEIMKKRRMTKQAGYWRSTSNTQQNSMNATTAIRWLQKKRKLTGKCIHLTKKG
ncbi:hypothetical protein ACROYT_G043266 [Oculina patagonica]